MMLVALHRMSDIGAVSGGGGLNWTGLSRA